MSRSIALFCLGLVAAGTAAFPAGAEERNGSFATYTYKEVQAKIKAAQTEEEYAYWFALLPLNESVVVTIDTAPGSKTKPKFTFGQEFTVDE